ncbi:MAG: hypothetical protein A2Y76_12810 [Planctomycetes bacterium RBG_13_60_9]|nr:MAG: hypothetical protein A2Y76_12810 [Planctomycetes bacterium RBG_13_60_9]
MNTEELAVLEEEWLSRQRSPTKDRAALYERIGVYAAWRDIFKQYVARAREGDVEAVKRALYLVWAERSGDPLLTGVKGLDEGSIIEVFHLVDGLARAGRIDGELQWMLPYYYVIDPLYLDRFEGYDALKRASSAQPFLLYRQRCLTGSFDHRGQMGEYWKTKQAHLRRWP